MSWETRRGRDYYYQARKVDGQVEKHYFGAGPGAEAVALLDALDRQQRAVQREQERQERQALEALDGVVEVVCLLAEAAMNEALTAAGYRRHARGKWRKKRGEGARGRRRGSEGAALAAAAGGV